MSNRKDAFYFPHDSNAHNDERILELRAEFGWEGYGIYWALIERMRDANDYRIRLRSLNALAMALSVAPDLLSRLTDFCVECGLLSKDEEGLWSPALNRRMEEVDERRKRRQEAGAKGGKQKSSNAKATDKQSSSDSYHERKGKEKKEEEKKGEREEDPHALVDGDGRTTTQIIDFDPVVRPPVFLADPCPTRNTPLIRPDGGILYDVNAFKWDACLEYGFTDDDGALMLSAWIEIHSYEWPLPHDANQLRRLADRHGAKSVTKGIRYMGDNRYRKIEHLKDFLIKHTSADGAAAYGGVH